MIRIGRLDLERWGHFDGRSLAFGDAGRLHVVYGPNEAGKSTTRRAVGALLFGVPARTRDTYGRPGADLRIGALLELDGVATEVVRRKGLKNTLLDGAGEVLDPAPLHHALGGLTGDVHAGLFEITHESLVQGGEELLAGRGAVGESLFAAAAGTSRLHALMRRLEGEADALFSTRPSKKELNLLLGRHAEALRVLRDVGLRPPRYEALARELDDLEAAYARAGAALEATEKERTRLERLRGALPLAAQRATRTRELAELGDVPVLGADAPARRAAAVERRDAARARAAAAEREIARRRARADELAVDEALLPALGELERLNADGSVVAQDAGRRDELAAARDALAVRLDEQLASLRRSLRDVDDAAPTESDDGGPPARVAFDAGARDRLEACLQARAGVTQAATAARAAVQEARRAVDRARREAAAAPTVVDDLALTAALRGARRTGDVDEQIARARAEQRAALAAADRAAGGDASALAAVAVPERETVERLLGEVFEAERVRLGLEAEAAAIADGVRLLEAQRDDLGAAAPALDAAALTTARVARDATWAKVRDALVAPLDEAEAEALAVEHEHTTTEADEVADERLRHAEDVTRLAQIERELAKLARDAADLGLRRERQAAIAARAVEAWAAAWAVAGAAAPTPEAAGAWLTARDAALAHLATAARAAEQAETAEQLRDEHAAAVRSALADAGASSDAGAPPALPLATLVEQAEAHLEILRGEADASARAAEAVQRAAAELEDAEAGLARAEAQLADWTSNWTALRDGCGLAESLAPDEALGALRGLEQAARDQQRLAGLSAEVDAIEARGRAFAAAVAAQVAALAADLADRPAAGAAQELHRRATAARAAAAERDAIAAALLELETERAEAVAIVAEADEELAALRAAAGAPDDAALVRGEQDSARAEALRAEIAALDGDLARAGGAPADAVLTAVADLDADAAPARAAELEALAVEQRDARDEAGRALTRARDELARLERSEEAARAKQAVATLEAQIREVAERYARARLAQRIQRDAIARYRSAHEGPLLARANALFPALTCERFARLETDVDDRDEDVLIAITADGARRRVEELSDGTREQLFLALRLAAIERHVSTAQPIPVLFDDVLLESDDDRARRILGALADLATQTQVIVLTHHRHLVGIAAETIAAERLDVIVLDAEPPGVARVAVTPESRPAVEVAAAAEPELEPDDAPAPDGDPTPTLAEELEAALAGAPAVVESPYGEQTSLL